MAKKKRKIEPWGNVTQQMEYVLEQMVYDHKTQYHEILGSVFNWLEMHAPHAKETFLDGSRPVYYYGHKDGLK